MRSALALVTALALAGGCRTLPPERDHEERAAERLVLGAYPEADALSAEARGDFQAALAVRRAIALRRPDDARAHRELFRVGLLAGRARRAGLDAVDYVFLSTDRAAASEDVARLYLAARLPLPAMPWLRRAIGYGGPEKTGRLRLLVELAEAAGDREGLREAKAALSGSTR